MFGVVLAGVRCAVFVLGLEWGSGGLRAGGGLKFWVFFACDALLLIPSCPQKLSV